MGAVVVIDMLNAFFQDGPLAARRGELAGAVNRLVQLARGAGAPVIWVRQEFAADLADAFLADRRRGWAETIAGTPGSQILPELDVRPEDPVIVKKRYSAFFRTGLEPLLETLAPQRLILAGINTHACVRMTAIDAYQRDYEVILAGEAVASYDAEHHEVSLRYMNGRIATVLNHAELVALLPPV